MRFSILLLIALAIGAFVTQWLLGDRGYVLIQFRGWAAEMSVPGLVLAMVLFYFAVRLLIHLIHLPRDLGEAAADFRASRAQKRLDRAFAALAEGKWGRSERLLNRVSAGPASLAGYLAGARAAQEQGALERRDDWLTAAYESNPGSAPAVLITQAELQLEAGQIEEAVATLRQMDTVAPGHPRGLVLMARALERQGDWAGLEALLPRLKGRNGLSDKELQELAVKVRCERLAEAPDGAALDATWQHIPRDLRRHPGVVAAYARTGLKLGHVENVERVIRKTLRHSWSAELVDLYGRIDAPNPNTQLAAAEGWLREHPEDPDVLTTCGRLCLRSELWGKARSYLETSLAIRPTPELWCLYGDLLTRMGESGAASEAFRKGLEASAGTAPALTAPRDTD
ncbi:MAG: heme biosynthesis HemY N-terminal domain-containing protein [Gammaproteobacteria bacterium]